jgi:hypothetical protein
MEKVIKLNKREIEVLEKALDSYKFSVQIKVKSDNMKRVEMAINELYNVESIEKKVNE